MIKRNFVRVNLLTMNGCPSLSAYVHAVYREIFEGLNFRGFRGLQFYTKFHKSTKIVL